MEHIKTELLLEEVIEKPDRPLPTALKGVAVLFIVGGVLAAVEMVSGWILGGERGLNLGILCFFVGTGLFKLKRGWRTCGLVFLWLGMIAVPVGFLWESAMVPYITFLGRRVSEMPYGLAITIHLFLFLMCLWSYRVLTRPEVRSLFGVGRKNLVSQE